MTAVIIWTIAGLLFVGFLVIVACLMCWRNYYIRSHTDE